MPALDTAPAPLDQVTLRRRGTGLIAHDRARCAGGYTLIAPQTAGGRVELVDCEGHVAHAWQMPCRPGRHAVLLPNGNLGYSGNHPDSPDRYPAWSLWHGGAFAEVTPDGRTVWTHTDLDHHHDTQWLANGHLLYGACAPLPGPIAGRLVGGSTDHDPPDGAHWGDVVREVDRAGALVWEWRVWEHLDPADYPIHPGFDRHHWPLINGLWATRGGLVLMSLRTTSGVIAVDGASGAVVWRVAHPMVSQQHAPVELDNGNLLVFDNGNVRPGIPTPYSRVVEIDPATGRLVWEYADPMKPAFFTPYMGSAQRLWNGNTHVTEAATGRLFEVTPAGEVVWEYVIPHFAEYPDAAARRYVPGHHNSVFRSFRYPATAIPWL
jgi:hypothetical protein